MYSIFWGEKKPKNLLEHFNRSLELNVGRLVQQILGGKKKKNCLMPNLLNGVPTLPDLGCSIPPHSGMLAFIIQ